MHAVETSSAAAGAGEPAAETPEASYAELIAIARDHGAEEIKHLTRAYQAIAPAGGGRMIDLTALVD